VPSFSTFSRRSPQFPLKSFMGAPHMSNFTQPAMLTFYKGLWMQCQGLPLIVLWAQCGIGIPDWGSPMLEGCGSEELSNTLRASTKRKSWLVVMLLPRSGSRATKHAKGCLILSSDPISENTHFITLLGKIQITNSSIINVSAHFKSWYW
jgi:hypothetical protein